MTRLLLRFAAGLALMLFAAPSAEAAKGQCLGGSPGAMCFIWDAHVGPVDDGDTLNVKVNGEGSLQKVRLNGVQAMELHVYKKNHLEGDCESIEAQKRLSELVKASGREVRLYAMDPNSRSVGERARFRRTVGVKVKGKWTDAGSVLMREGYAIWLPNAVEWAWNGPYSRLAQQAQQDGRNLWNPRNCGTGPSASSPIAMKVKWDAEDNDANDINGEWVRLTNQDPVNPISLKDWWLRDSYLRGDLHGLKKGHGYTFPASAVIPPGGSIRVHAGKGSNGGDQFFWGLPDAPFENASDDRIQAGDGAYLFDPRGNVRAFVQYPCRVSCFEPLAGKVKVHARYEGLEHEWVTITNTSPAPISLDQYELESVPWFYEFDSRDVLQPGKAITVWINEPHEVPVGAAGVRRVFVNPRPGLSIPGLTDFATSTMFRSWGHREALLGDGKDVVTLRNPEGAPVECDSWGGERCPSV